MLRLMFGPLAGLAVLPIVRALGNLQNQTRKVQNELDIAEERRNCIEQQYDPVLEISNITNSDD